MTISSTVRKAGPFAGHGTTSEFPFEFKVFSAEDLYVVQYNEATNLETVLELDSDYTVTLNADQNEDPGGTVELTSNLPTGYTLTITSDIGNLQPTDLTNRGGFYPSVINDALDRSCIQIQQLAEDVSRAVKVALSSEINVDLPHPTANELIGWDATATNLVNINPSTIATVVAYATAYADTFEADGVTTDWVLTRNPAVLYNLDVSIAGVTQVPVTDYTLSGKTFSTTSPAPAGAIILVKYKEGLPNYEGDAQDVRYVPSGTGAVETNVAAKLSETVSVKDFGAVGDGVTDDTAAIQAAFDAIVPGGVITSPSGMNYRITAPITARSSVFDGGHSRFTIVGDINGFVVSGGEYRWKNFSMVGTRNPTGSTNMNAITGDVHNAVFEQIHLSFFNVGFNFSSNSYLLSVRDCDAYNCLTGFKNYSAGTAATTTVFDRCYAHACTIGFDIYGVSDGELRNCAVDVYQGDYALPTSIGVRIQYGVTWNVTAQHFEGAPYNPGSGIYTCFRLIYTGGVSIIGTNFDVYENAYTTRLVNAVAYHSPYNHLTVSNSRQVPKGTMPTIERYVLRTDDASSIGYLRSDNNAWIDTNATIIQNDGNAGSWYYILNETVDATPTQYLLTGSGAATAVVATPPAFTAVHTASSSFNASTTPATFYTFPGAGMYLITTWVSITGTTRRSVGLYTSDGTDADFTSLKAGSFVTLSVSGMNAQMAIGSGTGYISYAVLRIA